MKARWFKVEGLSSTSESGPGVRSSHGMSAVEGKGEGNHNEVWVVGGEAKAREPAGMDVFCLKVGEGEGEGEGEVQGEGEGEGDGQGGEEGEGEGQ